MKFAIPKTPAILIGAKGGKHRYYTFRDRPKPVYTDAVPPQPGGHAIGCSLAHALAVKLAMTKYAGSPVILYEDDAVKTSWYADTVDVPDTADVIWLGVSNWTGHPINLPLAQWVRCDYNTDLGRITGKTYAAHAVALLTEKAKTIWLELAERASKGEWEGYTDLAYSEGGWDRLEQYFVRYPLFYQPDHSVTHKATPLDR